VGGVEGYLGVPKYSSTTSPPLGERGLATVSGQGIGDSNTKAKYTSC